MNGWDSIFIILPDQLFYTSYSIQCLNLSDEIYIVEEPLYYDKFCKNKMILHRASMKYYYNLLKENISKPVKYINRKKFYLKGSNDFTEYFKDIHSQILMFYIADINMFEDVKYKKFNGLQIKFFDTPAFLLSYKYIRMYYKSKTHYEF